MFRILIWGVGYQYSQCINAIKYQEIISEGEIKVVGVTDRYNLYDCLDGYPFIPVGLIKESQVDYIAVTSEANFEEIRMQAVSMGFLEETVILARVFCLPGFKFEKYVELLHSQITIIASNCWGGAVYHTLEMQFRSPFINMFMGIKDYLKLLNNPQYYLGLRLQFEQFEYITNTDIQFPVCKLDDVRLYFNHYRDMKEVEAKWYPRVKRINWDNLFIMLFTEKEEEAEAFNELKYQKKVCFLPFVKSLPSVLDMQIMRRTGMQDTPFWQVVNGTARGVYHDYDLIDLLLSGQVNHDRYYVE